MHIHCYSSNARGEMLPTIMKYTNVNGNETHDHNSLKYILDNHAIKVSYRYGTYRYKANFDT